jgi:SAM-dependent methyltransferase
MTLSQVAFKSPSADLSCGDGIFSFLHAAGEFAESFDVFAATGELERVTAQHVDMFDVETAKYAPEITARPEWSIGAATDLKPNMLAKAQALGFYDELIQHDNNRPLPFDDDALATIYCNSAYWVANIDAFLAELARITRPGGCIVLHVKLADMRDYTLRPFRAALGDPWLDIIGRSRMVCWPTVATQSEWERRFTAAGLEWVAATPFVTRTHAHIWDIGLRPIAPLLVRMTQALTPETRLSIKRDWLALFEQLLAPICRPDFDLFDTNDPPAEIQYVLQPRDK